MTSKDRGTPCSFVWGLGKCETDNRKVGLQKALLSEIGKLLKGAQSFS